MFYIFSQKNNISYMRVGSTVNNNRTTKWNTNAMSSANEPILLPILNLIYFFLYLFSEYML